MRNGLRGLVNGLVIRGIVRAVCVAAGLGLAVGTCAAADPGKLVVSVDKPGAKIDPNFYGLMTEEINFSYDGGLYAELIQNRIFKNTPPVPQGRGRGNRGGPATAPASTGPAINPNLVHWSVHKTGGAAGAIAIDTEGPVNTGALSNSLRLDISAVAAGEMVGAANDGYWGIPVKANTQYKASFYAKASGVTGPLTVAIVGNDGKVYASAPVVNVGSGWGKHEVMLKTGEVTATAEAKFVISAGSKGSVWLSLVSLFPPTYKDRVNGFRPDLMELLAGMKPAFLRFPGGNYLEGPDFENRFNWKATIGPYENRPGHMSPWRYRSSDGMGLLEFLYWCEDLKMKPIIGVYAGLHIDNGRNIITGDALKPFVQEALEEIEYITGDRNTKWGAQRAQDGHPEPFKLTYVEIGNEDFLNMGMATYNERFTMFYDAIKAKYPNLQIISTLRPQDPIAFQLTRRPDLIDDHLYSSAVGLATGTRRFDNYDRANPKIFMGEWAAREGSPTTNFNAAMGDAAFLSGLERNADVVIMECYAPLLVNVNPGGSQWNTNLIGYDALNSFGSPSYYMQKMYVENRGDTVLPIAIQPQTPPPAPPAPAAQPIPATAPAGTGPATTAVAGRGRGRGGPPQVAAALIGSAARLDASGEIIVKIVNPYNVPQQMEIDLQGVKDVDKNATVEVITGQPTDQNSLAEPKKIVPKKIAITNAAPKFVHEFPGNSISVLRIKARQ